MFNKLIASFLLCVMLVCTPACDDFSAEAQAVRDCWKNYIQYTNDLDGEKAVELLSAASIARYENIKKLALDADASQVKVLSNVDQYELLSMRAGLTRSQLMKMDARAYIVYAVNEGWWTMEDAAVELGAIKIRKDVASAKIVDAVADVKLEFVRENGQWKLDEPASDRYFNDYLARLATRNNLSQTDLVVRLIDLEFGPQKESKLFSPMR